MKNRNILLMLLLVVLVHCKKNPVDGNKDTGDSAETKEYVITRITGTSRDVYDGKFTANGEQVIYAIWDNEVSEIHSVDINGDNDTILLSNLGDGIIDGPILSPNDNQLAFVVQYVSSPNRLHICNSDGTQLDTLVTKSSLFLSCFSTDGSKVLYNYYHTMSHIVANSIWLIDVDGSEDRELTYGYNAVPISISHDGNTILYASDSEGSNFGAFTMDLNGNNITRITPDSLYLFPIGYSPSGEKILCRARQYDNNDGNLNREIYSVNSDGSGLTRLTNNDVQDYPIAFSPTEDKIVFYRDHDIVAASGRNSEIFIMDIDGKSVTRLTHNDDVDYPKAFSPDGTKILFQSDRGGNQALYIMDLE